MFQLSGFYCSVWVRARFVSGFVSTAWVGSCPVNIWVRASFVSLNII